MSRPHYCTSGCLLLAAALLLGGLSCPEQIRKDLRCPSAGLQIREQKEVITLQKLFIYPTNKNVIEYQNPFLDFEYLQGLQASILAQTPTFMLAILVRVGHAAGGAVG